MRPKASAIDFDQVWRRVREATGWRQQNDLAAFLGIKASSVSDSKARAVFRSEWAQRIGETYKVSSDWLLTGEGPMKRGEGAEGAERETRAAEKREQHPSAKGVATLFDAARIIKEQLGYDVTPGILAQVLAAHLEPKARDPSDPKRAAGGDLQRQERQKTGTEG